MPETWRVKAKELNSYREKAKVIQQTSKLLMQSKVDFLLLISTH